ncbi:MAG: hypothetical protein H7288_22980 [Kineosporiaceae bacterium]|nr:hypothetical protein [Aeromicrobium sp.]
MDTTLDLHFDAGGKDPDRFSSTIRSYHCHLWRKPLPCGAMFDLEDIYPNGYPLHQSDRGPMLMSSDTIIRTFRNRRGMSSVIGHIPESDRTAFSRLGYTIGGMTIFPMSQVDGKFTINQARGINRRIGDRSDLTLECIRRHYADGGASPLATVLARYSDFFELFRDFRGYVDFFLLQDLVTADYSEIRFFAPFLGFHESLLPASADDYIAYRSLTIDFVNGRNKRIVETSNQN